ncbi:MAG: hypothetical protein N3E36_02340 [Sulfolobales archaeon]|nr:hypothetical protein [Sulfolobales archaeon]MCX8198853.1 hypothetical protein [Sulfolobales archaeon]MDW8170749.1 hypothetical protein [Desulfurococcaceae archaeon]
MLIASDPISASILISLVMLYLTLLLYIVIRVLKPKHSESSDESREMYLGGEHPSILSKPHVLQSGLYWAIVFRDFKKAYRGLVEKMHTGRVIDWAYYMTAWLLILLLLAIIALGISALV